MAKEIVGYCHTCGRKTRHRVVECHDSVPERVFETIVTLGWSMLFSRNYECECVQCGTIHTLSK